MKFRLLSIATLALFSISVQAADEEWTSLFDGKSLDGWEQKGGKATYAVEDGAIVGTSAPKTENTFLCSTQTYGDFILEFEFMAHEVMNSGVQIRSESKEKYRNFRVHGYQVELEEEERERRWSGGIYDEARRGWLYPRKDDEAHGALFTAQGNRLWKAGDWNTIRIKAEGDRIQTWINGELRTDLVDDMTSEGFIGLQVHGVGDKEEPMSVRWRNIRIQEL